MQNFATHCHKERENIFFYIKMKQEEKSITFILSRSFLFKNSFKFEIMMSILLKMLYHYINDLFIAT